MFSSFKYNIKNADYKDVHNVCKINKTAFIYLDLYLKLVYIWNSFKTIKYGKSSYKKTVR